MATTMNNARCLSLVALLGLGVACAPNPPPGAIYVERRPPPARVEVIGVAPGVPRQRGFRHWSPGHWRHTRRGWYWVEGRWR